MHWKEYHRCQWVVRTFQIVMVFVSGISYLKPTVTLEARLCFVIFREEDFHPFPFPS